MKCLRCSPLIKAIDAYLAKAENDLYEQLTMEGYLKAKRASTPWTKSRRS